MTKYTALIFSTLVAILIVSQGCNPDCNSASTQNIVIDPGTSAILAGRTNQILLRSQPSNFIVGRKIFMDDPVKGFPARTQLMETDFTPELNGLIVTIPESLAGVSTPAIYVEDPDCSSEVILVNTLPIQEEDFFFFSDVFVVPPMPLIIIPTIPVLPPVNITNAWISPYDRSYCIWFVPELDDAGNELSILREYKPGIDEADMAAGKIDKIGTREFIVCGDTPQRNPTAGVNPVSGVIDKETGFIQFAIDRTQHGLGIERFTGMFISDEQIPDTPEWRNGGPCEPTGTERLDFMFVTSEKTGQQLLMVKVG